MRQSMLVLAVFLGGIPVVSAFQAPGETERSQVTLVAAKTGKERLGDKSSDEQRVDDCKVPEDRRGRSRPADCRNQH